MNYIMFLALGGSTAGGVVIGALFGPFRDRVARQTYCVVRKYARPEAMQVLFEARLPKRAGQWMHEHQDGTLSVELRTDVDAFNAAALRKQAWWVDLKQLMDAFLAQQAATHEPEEPWADPLEPRMVHLEQQQTEVLSLLRQMTGELPVVVEWKDPAPLDQRSRAEAISRAHEAGFLSEPQEWKTGVPVAHDPVLGDEPSVMPQLAPTEYVSLEEIQREARERELADEASRRLFMAERVGKWTDPAPDNPYGIPLRPNPTTKTVVIPLKDAVLPKPPGDSVGGDQ